MHIVNNIFNVKYELLQAWKFDGLNETLLIYGWLQLLQKLKEQYDCENEWHFESLSQFSFAQGSDQVKIEMFGNKWEPVAADVEILNDDKVLMYVYV